MSFAQPFQSYQPYGSQTTGSEAKKPFSSTVDFSDQSYEMPFFVDIEPSTMKPGGSVERKPLAVQPITNAPQSIPKQSTDDRNKILQGNISPVMTKGPEKAPLLPPRKPTFKANPAAFLESFEIPSMQNFYIEPTALNPNSHQWLNQDPLFINWKSSKHGLLWLRGSEGCGKSTLMKHALQSQLNEEPNAIHLIYSFSMCGSEVPRSRLGFYKALMHQLIPQSPETFSDVKARFDKIESALPLRQKVAWGAQELYEDLTKAIAKLLKTRSVTIYVDGIDRSEGETASKLVQDFSKLLEKSQPKPTTKEPTITHGLKIIFSSTLVPAKDPFPRSYIDVDEKNGPSLAQFLEEQLSTTDFNTRQLVLSKSGSSFISARLIINHIKLFGPAQSSLVQQPSPTPAPISFLLGDYFQNLAQQANKSLMSLLTWCCLTSRPLTLAELRVALSLDMMPKLESSNDLLNAEPFSRYSSDESFQSWIKTTSWGLVETVSLRGQRVVKVMHDSISAFFLSNGLDMLSYGSQQPDSPSSPLQRAHHSLATCLLRYLALLPKEPQWQSRFQTEPALHLLQYAGTNWSIHVSAAGLSKPEASKILKLLQWPSDSVFSPLVKLDQDNSAIAELNGTLWAHIFAVYGHAPLLSVGIKKAGTEALGVVDTQKRSPLHHAALHGHLAASKQLLKSGAKANARAINGQTALHFAVLQGYQSVLKPLLDSDPSLVSATNEFAQTPLLLAVVRGSSSAIKLLLERSADAKALDRFKTSILHHAVSTDKANVLKLILDGGADINLQDGQGRTPLHLAIAENRSAVIKVLFERSCRVDIGDKEGKRALHVAAASGNKSCAQELLKQKVAVDWKDVHGQTALVYAVQGLHVNLIKLLLEAKADVNMKDKLGFSVLMLAVRANQEKITKLLLEANPDLNALSGEGHTVIYYAVYREKPVPLLSDQEQFVASLLLKHYKKRYSIWDQEWLACKDRFAAEHGKKKKEVDAKSKPKAESKKKTAPPSSSVPSKATRAPKPVKPVDAARPTASAGAQMTASKPSPPVTGPQDSAKHSPQPGATTTTQSQTTATTHSPFAPGAQAPVTPPVVQQQQTFKPNISTSMSADKQQQQQQTSSFMSYQPSQPTTGAKEQAISNAGGPLAKPAQPPRPVVVTEQQKAPMNHRNSWAMYSALSSGSPASSQGTPPAVQNSYFSYSGPSQQSSGSNSFKPFQPFQAAAPRAQSQVNHRSSLPSQRSLGQPAPQQGAVQSYQPFSSTTQTSSASPYLSQASYQSHMDPSIKPTAPLSLGRKPVGGHQPTQPMTDKSAKPSPNNLWQPYQAPAVMEQAAPGKQNIESSVASPPLSGPNNPPQAAQGNQSPAPGTSQKSMPAQQTIPAQKPPSPQQAASSAHAVASQRPALAQNPISQKPAVAQSNPSQMPAPAQQPIATHRPVLAKTNQTPSPVQQAAPGRKPVPGQVPLSQKPAPSQQPTAAQQPAQAPKASSAQKPPSSQKLAPTQQPPANQKPAVSQAPPGQKPALVQQPATNQKTAPGQPTQAQKPPPAKQPGAGQKPASAKQATVDQKSTSAKQTVTEQKSAPGQAPQGQKPAPAKQPATDQKPLLAKQTAADKKPAPGQAPQAQKPAPAQQPASASKPASDQKKPAPSASAKTPGQASSVQKPDSSVPKKPSPSPAQSSGSSQKVQPATGQRSVETYGSRGMHTQSHDAKNDGSGKSSAGKIAAVTGAGLVAGGVGGYTLSNYYEEHHYENNFVNEERSMNPDQGYYQPVPPSTHTEYYYLQTPAEQSEHSAEESEAGESEDDHQSDNESEAHESEADESVSFSVDVSDAEDSDEALSEDEEDNDLDSIDGDSDDGDDVDSLNFNEDDSDSLHLATDFTDDENEDENGDDSDIENDFENDVEAGEDTDADVSDDDIINRSIQEESDSDHDADLGQDDSDSDQDVAQEEESDQDSDVEPQHGNFTGYHQHQTNDEADSDNEEQQAYYGNHQQQAVEESDPEDDVQQTHYHDQYQEQEHFQEQTHYQGESHYQEQTHFQNQYQQQTFQQEESDEEDQPVHYSNQEHVVNQSDSEDEDEVQQDHYHDQYQQQNQYGQYQQQVQPDSEDEFDNQVDGQADDSDEEVNNYGQADSDDDGYNAGGNYGGGNYTGAGYDSDY